MAAKKVPQHSSVNGSSNGSDAHALIIAGKTIPVTHEIVSVDTLSLDPSNPRIRFQIEQKFGTRKLSESDLMALIREQPGYDALHKGIRKNRGLQEPVVIRHNGDVVEGNSRLTVFKALYEHSPADFGKIPVVRLGKDVPEELIALLMASYHVAGKTPWRPYAQADQIHQLKTKFGFSLEQIADQARMAPKEVEQYLQAFEYLVNDVLPELPKGKGHEILENKFSHALEFVKRRSLTDLRKNKKVRKDFAKLLVQNKIKGAEVRQLDKVLKHKEATKVLKKKGFTAAREILKADDPTIASGILRAMEKLTKNLGKMRGAEVDALGRNAKARAIVKKLHAALLNLASVSSIPMGN